MAAKKPAAAGPKSGRLRRLIRFTVFFLGLLTVAGIVDYFVTSYAVKGRWQFHAPSITESTVDTMMERAEQRGGREGGPGQEGRGPRRMGPAARSMVTQIGNKLMGAVASQVRLEVVDGGYRLDNGMGVRAAMGLFASNGGPDGAMSGCLSGTYLAAFPLVRVTCGDGSGQTLWFLMKGWPSQEMRLFPIPLGNDKLERKAREMVGNGGSAKDRLKAVNELLTLRFTRESSP